MDYVTHAVASRESDAQVIADAIEDAEVLQKGAFTYIVLRPHATVCRAWNEFGTCGCHITSLVVGQA